MHSCSKIHNKLVDLVFNEIGEEERFSLMQELNTCRECRELYKDMTGTLTLFDRLTDGAMPEESYWVEYEARLWSGLREEVRPSGWRQRLRGWMNYNPASRWLLPAAAAALALIMIGGLWAIFTRSENNVPVASVEPHPPDVASRDSAQKEQEQAEADKSQTENSTPKEEQTEPPKKYSNPRKPGLELVSLPRKKRNLQTEQPQTIADLNIRLTEHLENSALLLRSFRNARPSRGKDRADIAFEKGLARRLLASNSVLRQEVEARGDLRSSELLAGLEPFLLDIANLPDRASPEEIGMIKDVLEEFGLISELQIYSAIALPPGL